MTIQSKTSNYIVQCEKCVSAFSLWLTASNFNKQLWQTGSSLHNRLWLTGSTFNNQLWQTGPSLNNQIWLTGSSLNYQLQHHSVKTSYTRYNHRCKRYSPTLIWEGVSLLKVSLSSPNTIALIAPVNTKHRTVASCTCK